MAHTVQELLYKDGIVAVAVDLQEEDHLEVVEMLHVHVTEVSIVKINVKTNDLTKNNVITDVMLVHDHNVVNQKKV